MKFTSFVDALSTRLGIPVDTTRSFVLALRDEILAQLAADQQEVKLSGFGSFSARVSKRHVCASNLPGRAGRVPVRSRYHLRFSPYSSGEAELGRSRDRLVSGELARPVNRRMKMAKSKTDRKKAGRSIEVSVPADVTEITIKIEKTGKKSESKAKRQLLG